MRTVSVKIGFIVLLIVLALTAQQALARRWDADADTRDKLSREYQRLIAIGQNDPDPEKQIAALNQALKLDAGFEHWPLRSSEAEIKGTILGCLGNSFEARKLGKRADNLEEAIKAFRAALNLLTPRGTPQQWATAQQNLATTYLDRIKELKSDNVERAIEGYQAALTVYTRRAFPQDWAMVQNGLANAYTLRIKGSKAENMEIAIKGYLAALTVRTREAHAQDWARTMGNLASAYHSRIKGSKADNIEMAIDAMNAALNELSLDTFPQDWAMAQNNLGNFYTDRIKGVKADNIELAIDKLKAALTVRIREEFPEEWAETQNNLATAYEDRIKGSTAENVELAIAATNAALAILTRDNYPEKWATEQNNLSVAYNSRIKGARSENLEAAIKTAEAALTVRTRDDYPEDWAAAQNNLAIAYSNRIAGSRADNLEVSINAYEAVLSIDTREAYPEKWAEAQSNLASVYLSRVKGSRADNIEAAIKACEAALTVSTRNGYPEQWAEAQNNLGLAYTDRAAGSKTENLRTAVKAYEAALTVLTKETFPEKWARTQENLGSVYCNCIKNSKLHNPEKAIEAYQASLTVYTSSAFPEQWAGLQYNLANAYRDRIKGDKTSNLEASIAAHRLALTVFTREAYPRYWAGVQSNLANAYRDRIEGVKEQNLEAAIKGYEEALTVYTRQAFPRDNLRVNRLLGQSFLDNHDWRAANEAYQRARDAFLLLFGEGLEVAEAQDIIAEAGPLFAEFAYVFAKLGDLPEALTLLNEGKAKMLAVALRQQSVTLPAPKQAELAKLKDEIREWSHRAEIKGEEGAQALRRLIGLRQALEVLLKDAFAQQVPAKDAVSLARTVLPEGGAIAALVVTKVGGKVLTITGRRDAPHLSELDLPELTTARLDEIMKGPPGVSPSGGWLAAFNIQYLPEPDRSLRNSEWLTAIENIGTSLGKLFGIAFGEHLAALNVKTGSHLIILPSGALGLLPLGLAQNPATGIRLGDSFEITEAQSLEALAAGERQLEKPEAPSFAIAVNPTGLSPRLALPFAETEGMLVATHFASNATTMLDKSNASPDLVLRALADKSYWHFSSHGFFDWDDARASGLLMKDGQPLTVNRLIEMQGHLSRPRLVVLSACETGIYDAERNPDEFVGLPAAFIEVGAAGVLGTLWQVDDMATALLIAKFYDLHIGDNLSPATALKGAQQWLRTATRVNLVEYAERQAQAGNLDLGRLADMKALLQTRRRSLDDHFAATWNTLQQQSDLRVQA